MTAVKVLTLLLIAFGILLFGKSGSVANFTTTPVNYTGFAGWSAFGTALLGSLWAYDGWNNLSMVAGEIKNPKRNIPISFIVGILSILALYVFVNFSFFFALPFPEILTSNSDYFPDALPVGTKAAVTFLGDSGIVLLSSAFVFSALGAMNGSILTSARVPYAMAKDGLFFSKLANVNERTFVPVMSIIVQALISMILALSGSFDQLTDYVVFASWIFYAMVTAAVFRLRKKRPELPREYKALGYPVLPAIFVIIGILLLINTIITSPKSTAIGLGLILLGVPFYLWFKKSKKSVALRSQ
jgi:APA family basic amino acid/polyamine antiporter